MTPGEHKLCRGCEYILDGLPEPRCPECGRPFDPDNPNTYWKGRRPYPRWPYFIVAVVALAPFLLWCLMLVNWVIASWQLGRPAQPYVDDPKYIGGVTTAFHTAVWLLLLGFFKAGLLLPIPGLIALGVTRRRAALLPIFAAIGATALSWLVAWNTVGIIGNAQFRWFFD